MGWISSFLHPWEALQKSSPFWLGEVIMSAYFSLNLIMASWHSFVLVSALPLSLTNCLLPWHYESFYSSYPPQSPHSFSNSNYLFILKIQVFDSLSTWLSHQSFLEPALLWNILHRTRVSRTALSITAEGIPATYTKIFAFSCFIRHTRQEVS